MATTPAKKVLSGANFDIVARGATEGPRRTLTLPYFSDRRWQGRHRRFVEKRLGM